MKNIRHNFLREKDCRHIENHMAGIVQPGGNRIEIVNRENGNDIKYNMNNCIYEETIEKLAVLSHMIGMRSIGQE